MTTDAIMVLADLYAEAERHDYLTGEGSVAAHRAALLNAVEALKADAEQWRAYKTRKDAVLAAGMGRNPLRDAAIDAARSK